MKRLQVMIVVVITLFAATYVSAQGVTPTYDVTGIWRSNDPGTVQYFQDGNDVKMIYVNKGFSHFFTGNYTYPKVIEGTIYRKNRSNGCLTKMRLKINLSSQDSITTSWVAQDSLCDLREGQTGSGTSQRDKKLEQSAWY